MCVCIWRVERLKERVHSSPPGKPKLSRWEGTQGRLIWSELSAEPLFLPQQRALRPGAVPGLQTVPGRSVGGGGGKLGVLVAEDSHLEGKLPLLSWSSVTTPSPAPYHFYADHTHDDELAAQLPAACLTREHQQAAGLALSSLLLLQPRGLGAPEGIRVGRGCRRHARGRGVPPGSAHGAAPWPPCFLELCSFDPSGSPCHCTARAPSGSPRPCSLSSPPRSLSPQIEAALVLSPPAFLSRRAP